MITIGIFIIIIYVIIKLLKIKKRYVFLSFITIVLFLFALDYFKKLDYSKYNSTEVTYNGEKIIFIQSNVYDYMFLVENAPKSDSLLKKILKDFIKEKGSKFGNDIEFYNYTKNMRYFLDNEEHDGGPTSYIFLSDYGEENIASFYISKCKTDTTKLVGRFHFYGNGGLVDGRSEIDTLIYHCK